MKTNPDTLPDILLPGILDAKSQFNTDDLVLFFDESKNRVVIVPRTVAVENCNCPPFIQKHIINRAPDIKAKPWTTFWLIIISSEGVAVSHFSLDITNTDILFGDKVFDPKLVN